MFQPVKIQTGQSASSSQKNSSVAKTKPPLIEEESPQSQDDFVFSTFPSGLDAGTSLPDIASEKNTASSSSTGAGWRAAKPTAPRPQPSTTTQPTQPMQPLPGNSTDVKEN